MLTLDISTMQANAERAEQLLALLANRNRLLILCNLTEGEGSVGQLVEGSSPGQSALSQHLAKLRGAGVVGPRRKGQVIHYRLASKEVHAIIETLFRLYVDQG